jgi:phosphoadenosine phosphosulfate reductase
VSDTTVRGVRLPPSRNAAEDHGSLGEGGQRDSTRPQRDVKSIREALKVTTQELEGQSAEQIIRWAAERYAPRLTFATGFGMEGCVIVDIVSRHALRVDLFTLDTGLLFPETYDLWKRLEERYGVRIEAVRPQYTVEEQAELEGASLWGRDPDRCCELRKMQPLRRVLEPYDAWLSAIRRDQTEDRADAPVVAWDGKFGLVKINPLVRWTFDDVKAYVKAHDVPVNALHEQGYPSIGCWPCTTAVAPGEDPRAGRWRGREKKECGLHILPPQAAS